MLEPLNLEEREILNRHDYACYVESEDAMAARDEAEEAEYYKAKVQRARGQSILFSHALTLTATDISPSKSSHKAANILQFDTTDVVASLDKALPAPPLIPYVKNKLRQGLRLRGSNPPDTLSFDRDMVMSGKFCFCTGATHADTHTEFTPELSDGGSSPTPGSPITPPGSSSGQGIVDISAAVQARLSQPGPHVTTKGMIRYSYAIGNTDLSAEILDDYFASMGTGSASPMLPIEEAEEEEEKSRATSGFYNNSQVEVSPTPYHAPVVKEASGFGDIRDGTEGFPEQLPIEEHQPKRYPLSEVDATDAVLTYNPWEGSHEKIILEPKSQMAKLDRMVLDEVKIAKPTVVAVVSDVASIKDAIVGKPDLVAAPNDAASLTGMLSLHCLLTTITNPITVVKRSARESFATQDPSRPDNPKKVRIAVESVSDIDSEEEFEYKSSTPTRVDKRFASSPETPGFRGQFRMLKLIPTEAGKKKGTSLLSDPRRIN